MRFLIQTIVILMCFFSNKTFAYKTADDFQFPLDNYSVGCNGYWGTCLKPWHLGEDASATATTKVYAIANGQVKEATVHNDYGGTYIIEHSLPLGEKVVSLYGHLNFKTFTKKKNDEVKKGDYLGEVGTWDQNGGWSEHLHFGIHKGGYGTGDSCFKEWIYSGYTSCNSTKNEWYIPSDFIRKYRINFKIMSAAILGGFIEWQTKDLEDLSCEHGVAWRVTHNWSDESFMTDSSYCPRACYQNEGTLDSNKWLDFFIRPTYADCGTEVAGSSPLVAGHVDTPGFPKETGSTAISGSRVDLLPDFDVFSDPGEDHEISANCHNSNQCWATPVESGQGIYLRLETQVHNANASGFQRKSSDTIEGPIWWRIEGKTDWQFIAETENKEFDVGNLKKCGNKCENNRETTKWTVPNYPGEILDLKAAVDGDDEIQEEGEGGRRKIQNPDTDCVTNNCSRIERFYIRPPSPETPPAVQPPVPFTQSAYLKWSSAGTIDGMACTQLLETADPDTWSDNYLCASRDFGLRWSSAGTINGMTCTQLLEASDPHTWNDNYLCTPNNSQLKLFWSSAGPVSGKECVQLLEAADPDTWSDNYLCHDPVPKTSPQDDLAKVMPIITEFLLSDETDVSPASVMPIISNLLLDGPELTVVVRGNGTVTSNPKGIKCPGACSGNFDGPQVTLAATAKKGYAFVGWVNACNQSRTSTKCKIQLLKDRTVAAVFKKK